MSVAFFTVVEFLAALTLGIFLISVVFEVFFKIGGAKLFDKFTDKIAAFIVSLFKGRGK